MLQLHTASQIEYSIYCGGFVWASLGHFCVSQTGIAASVSPSLILKLQGGDYHINLLPNIHTVYICHVHMYVNDVHVSIARH